MLWSEIDLPVKWRKRLAKATFVCSTDVNAQSECKLVRVHICGCSVGRRDALMMEAPVAAWEARAVEMFVPGKVPL